MRPTPSPERVTQLATTLYRLARTQRNLPLLATEQEHTDLREAGYALASLSADLASLKAELQKAERTTTQVPCPPPTVYWRCFFCGYMAIEKDQAEQHFGGRFEVPECRVVAHPTFKALAAELVALKAERAKHQAAFWPHDDEGVRMHMYEIRNCSTEEYAMEHAEALADLLRPDPPTVAERAWQPIETAPKDGTAVILLSPVGDVYRGAWRLSSGGEWAWRCGDRWMQATRPIGWIPMPLPPPPASSERGKAP